MHSRMLCHLSHPRKQKNAKNGSFKKNSGQKSFWKKWPKEDGGHDHAWMGNSKAKPSLKCFEWMWEHFFSFERVYVRSNGTVSSLSLFLESVQVSPFKLTRDVIDGQHRMGRKKTEARPIILSPKVFLSSCPEVWTGHVDYFLVYSFVWLVPETVSLSS